MTGAPHRASIMHFTCIYKSGTKFGTGQQSSNYVARVTSKDEAVTVEFDFRSHPQGKSHPGVSNASVRSLQLNLSRNEALQLAASIIAQAHHPTIHDSTATWIPPEFMPTLTRNQWSRKLIVSHRCWNNEIRIGNATKFHIGRIEFEVHYETYEDEEQHTTTIWKLVDLPPGSSTMIDVDENDIPWQHRKRFSQMTNAEAVTVTGVTPGAEK